MNHRAVDIVIKSSTNVGNTVQHVKCIHVPRKHRDTSSTQPFVRVLCFVSLFAVSSEKIASIIVIPSIVAVDSFNFILFRTCQICAMNVYFYFRMPPHHYAPSLQPSPSAQFAAFFHVSTVARLADCDCST